MRKRLRNCPLSLISKRSPTPKISGDNHDLGTLFFLINNLFKVEQKKAPINISIIAHAFTLKLKGSGQLSNKFLFRIGIGCEHALKTLHGFVARDLVSIDVIHYHIFIFHWVKVVIIPVSPSPEQTRYLWKFTRVRDGRVGCARRPVYNVAVSSPQRQ